MKFDLRRDDPYSLYDRFEFDIPTGKGLKGPVGDCWDRYWVRIREMEESVRILRQALEQLPEGDYILPKVPKLIKPPKGDCYFRVENPRGELGYYLVSDGKTSPYRLKVRSPAFTNLGVVPAIAEGVMLADLVSIFGSIDIVLGEVDR